MQKLTPLLFLLCVCTTAWSQEETELDRKNGFKDLKLGMSIDSVKGYKLKKEFKEKEEFPAKLYTVEHPAYANIGEVKVKSVELKTYKDLVYEIAVITDKDPRLMKALQSLFGKADYDPINETYFWRGKTMVLKFKAEGKNNLSLHYISYSIHQMMKQDKNKKVDDIANDF